MERQRPHLFDHRGEAHDDQQEARGGDDDGSRGGKAFRVVRSYRTKEDVWARSRRKNVSQRVLEELLATWRAGTGGMTPAEFGAAFIGEQVGDYSSMQETGA